MDTHFLAQSNNPVKFSQRIAGLTADPQLVITRNKKHRVEPLLEECGSYLDPCNLMRNIPRDDQRVVPIIICGQALKPGPVRQEVRVQVRSIEYPYEF